MGSGEGWLDGSRRSDLASWRLKGELEDDRRLRKFIGGSFKGGGSGGSRRMAVEARSEKNDLGFWFGEERDDMGRYVVRKHKGVGDLIPVIRIWEIRKCEERKGRSCGEGLAVKEEERYEEEFGKPLLGEKISLEDREGKRDMEKKKGEVSSRVGQFWGMGARITKKKRERNMGKNRGQGN